MGASRRGHVTSHSRRCSPIRAMTDPSTFSYCVSMPVQSTLSTSMPIYGINAFDPLTLCMCKKEAHEKKHTTKTQLVPGEINENDPVLQNIPVVLIQRPGSQVSNYKRIGYGSGWDIIMPAGYAMSFWQTFVMFGARCGGLRESRNLSFEMSEINLPPDSTAGNLEEKRIEQELREKYFRRPPSKRVNYQKIAINSPFICPWKILLSDWSGENVDDFFVLRDKKLINDLQNCITAKKAPPHIDKAVYCLVAVCLQMIGKGNLKQHALVCLPQQNDIENIKELFEPLHEDNKEKLRKEKRKQHRLLLKQLKKKRRKFKEKSNMVKIVKHKLKQTGVSEYVKNIRFFTI
ncbi:unnamed protein product, partial [Iphiclides podalirius]